MSRPFLALDTAGYVHWFVGDGMCRTVSVAGIRRDGGRGSDFKELEVGGVGWISMQNVLLY